MLFRSVFGNPGFNQSRDRRRIDRPAMGLVRRAPLGFGFRALLFLAHAALFSFASGLFSALSFCLGGLAGTFGLLFRRDTALLRPLRNLNGFAFPPGISFGLDARLFLGRNPFAFGPSFRFPLGTFGGFGSNSCLDRKSTRLNSSH